MGVRARLVLATANRDKALEIAELLGRLHGVELASRPPSVPEVEETGSSLEENARLKARAVMGATREAAVADDTGLEVEALGGAPGLYTARYAGEGATYADNVAKLLAELEGAESRRARFRTVALVAFPDGSEVSAEGILAGSISTEARGNRGFGYDPVFVPDGGGGRTLAELGPEEKNAMSHRALAFGALVERLGDRLGPTRS
jgi:XTP/dITP diphosphohydrolase